jgi:transposase-like protein
VTAACLLQQLTKRVIEAALDGEITDHLGYEKHDPAGEISAHLAEVYGAHVSRQAISTINDKVMNGMAELQNRPLDRGSIPSSSWTR